MRRAVRGGLGLGLCLLTALALVLSGCGSRQASSAAGPLRVVATTSFLTDIAQNVAGSQFRVHELIPIGVDPHEFSPTPTEVATVVGSQILIVNGGNLEGPLLPTLRNAGGDYVTVTAAAGLRPRRPKQGEPAAEQPGEPDPHFWLDPIRVITYVSNIEHAFAVKDPKHAVTYKKNAAAYIERLRGLDRWIRKQVATVPSQNRKLVMDHLSHGYFADRYGFRIVGAVLPSVSSEASTSAASLAALVSTIHDEHVKVVFVDLAENPALARQVADAAHVKVVTDLIDHSLTGPGGPAPTYLTMMRYDTRVIVNALR